MIKKLVNGMMLPTMLVFGLLVGPTAVFAEDDLGLDGDLEVDVEVSGENDSEDENSDGEVKAKTTAKVVVKVDSEDGSAEVDVDGEADVDADEEDGSAEVDVDGGADVDANEEDGSAEVDVDGGADVNADVDEEDGETKVDANAEVDGDVDVSDRPDDPVVIDDPSNKPDKLIVEGICSDDEDVLKWEITNPNDVEVDYKWRVLNSTQADSDLIGAGETVMLETSADGNGHLQVKSEDRPRYITVAKVECDENGEIIAKTDGDVDNEAKVDLNEKIQVEVMKNGDKKVKFFNRNNIDVMINWMLNDNNESGSISIPAEGEVTLEDLKGEIKLALEAMAENEDVKVHSSKDIKSNLELDVDGELIDFEWLNLDKIKAEADVDADVNADAKIKVEYMNDDEPMVKIHNPFDMEVVLTWKLKDSDQSGSIIIPSDGEISLDNLKGKINVDMDAEIDEEVVWEDEALTSSEIDSNLELEMDGEPIEFEWLEVMAPATGGDTDTDIDTDSDLDTVDFEWSSPDDVDLDELPQTGQSTPWSLYIVGMLMLALGGTMFRFGFKS